MVVDFALDDATVDRLFQALANATRRDIVRRAIEEETSVSALARRYPMSTTAIQKHVAVLEKADLVVLSKRGREQIVSTRIETLERARGLLSEIEYLWTDRVERIDTVLGDLNKGETT